MKGLRLAARLRALLADGHAHAHHEVVLALVACIPPENATWEYRRIQKKATKVPRPPSLARQVQIGRKSLAYQCLRRLNRRGIIERLGDDQQWTWRATANEQVANGGQPVPSEQAHEQEV